MSLPEVTSREQWLIARRELLGREEELTRLRRTLNADRRRLPVAAIGKDYTFEGPAGQVGLPDLFDGCSQLIVQHVMFDPSWDDVCRWCSTDLVKISPALLADLRSHDTAFAPVSRAPFAEIAVCQARRGWDFAWYSSFGSDFNYDFHVTLDEAVAPVEYNYRTRAEHVRAGTETPDFGKQSTEMGGLSCFLRADDTVYHAYSVYDRDASQLSAIYGWLGEEMAGLTERL